MSDQWRAYNGIVAIAGGGFYHLTVNLNFVDPNIEANTQRIERSWKASKERNKRDNGTHRSMLDLHMWRTRTNVRNLYVFDAVLADIVLFGHRPNR